MSESGSSKKPRLDPNLLDLLEELECPVCRKYMTPPISLCMSGHSICKTCRHKLKKCQICTKKFTEARNLALENIIRKVKLPCKYEDLGCTGLFSLERLALHQSNCSGQANRCPFKVLDTSTCAWQGSENAVVDHIRTNHSDICGIINQAAEYKTRICGIVKFPLWCRAVVKQDDVFLWCTKLSGSHLYSCLLYLGAKEEAASFTFRMTFNKLGKSECFRACHRTYPYPSNVDKIFQSLDCIILYNDCLRFCMDAEKCLRVAIEIFRRVQDS